MAMMLRWALASSGAGAAPAVCTVPSRAGVCLRAASARRQLVRAGSGNSPNFAQRCKSGAVLTEARTWPSEMERSRPSLDDGRALLSFSSTSSFKNSSVYHLALSLQELRIEAE